MITLRTICERERDREDGTRDILVRYKAGHYTINKNTTIFKNCEKPLVLFNIEHDYDVEYLPDIYARYDCNYDTVDFEIQTTAYGTIKPEEIGKVIAGYQEAQELALTLRKMFVEEV